MTVAAHVAALGQGVGAGHHEEQAVKHDLGVEHPGMRHVEHVAGRRERQTKEFEAQREVIAKQEEYIRRNMAGQNTAQAKGRLKRLNRLERLEKPIEQRVMLLRMSGSSRSGNIVLETHGLKVGYRDAAKALFSPPNLQLLRPEKDRLLAMTPGSYTGMAVALARRV